MALVLNEKYAPGSYRLFISNRLLRLFPAYLLVLALSLVVTGHWKQLMSLDPFDAAYFVVSQLVIIGQETYFFWSFEMVGWRSPCSRPVYPTCSTHSPHSAGMDSGTGDLLLSTRAVAGETRTDRDCLGYRCKPCLPDGSSMAIRLQWGPVVYRVFPSEMAYSARERWATK